MDPLVRYFLQQASRGRHDGIGPIYAAPPFVQRGYGIGSFFWQGYGEWLDRSSGVVPRLWSKKRYVPEAIS